MEYMGYFYNFLTNIINVINYTCVCFFYYYLHINVLTMKKAYDTSLYTLLHLYYSCIQLMPHSSVAQIFSLDCGWMERTGEDDALPSSTSYPVITTALTANVTSFTSTAPASNRTATSARTNNSNTCP